MLNSYSGSSSSVSNSIKFNAVSGTMFKSCNGSFFLKFHLNSELAEMLFSAVPKYPFDTNIRWEKEHREMIVLQTMIVGDMEVMAEIIEKSVYESMS